MVINYEVHDLESFKSRLDCTKSLLCDAKLWKPYCYLPCGFISKNQAKRAYEVNKKYDDKQRRKHKFIEHFVEISTYLPTDVLFETMVDMMDILGTNSLTLYDFKFIDENVPAFYEKYKSFKEETSESENV
ncbi:MAG: hypothetical protein IJW24_00555 [Clostridia bacterium]|nr:hypothetical protein [Clostridia bacterium]